MPSYPAGRKGRRPRIGVFGGTFDPPHVGHVSAACDVADALSLDRVIWIPARRSPLKAEAPTCPDELRLEMVRAAVLSDPRFEVSPIELERAPPSYTIDTLRSLRDRLGPGPELYLIVGVDQARSFGGWRDPEGIAALATLVVMDREGEGADALLGGGIEALRVPVTRIDVSSTRVRATASAGGPLTDLVPAGVAELLEAEAPYRR